MLKRMLSHRPDDPALLYELAWSLEADGRADEATSHFERALEIGLEPEDDQDARISLGRLYLQAGHYDRARQILSSLEDSHGPARVYVAIADYHLDQTPEAMRALIELLTSSETKITEIRAHEDALMGLSEALQGDVETHD